MKNFLQELVEGLRAAKEKAEKESIERLPPFSRCEEAVPDIQTMLHFAVRAGAILAPRAADYRKLEKCFINSLPENHVNYDVLFRHLILAGQIESTAVMFGVIADVLDTTARAMAADMNENHKAMKFEGIEIRKDLKPAPVYGEAFNDMLRNALASYVKTLQEGIDKIPLHP